MKMISRQFNLTFFLCLVLSVVCISCAAMEKDQPEPLDIPPDSRQDAIYERRDKAVPSSGYYTHTVKLPGESLSIIAKWFTGDLKNWETLAKYNPTINPNRIFLGDKIQIPRPLMIRHDRMTQKFIEESQPKSRQRVSPAAPPEETGEELQEKEPEKAVEVEEEEPQPAVVQPEPEPEEEPFLFGPRSYPKK
ncbi:MAG: LysM peptidoglycan-binding domain-containing protein [Desulfobulbaceae bacterium]|nr:LysM peptidoglycan-binding domain-containing protein [Desulfobulbaceae bacterium]